MEASSLHAAEVALLIVNSLVLPAVLMGVRYVHRLELRLSLIEWHLKQLGTDPAEFRR